MEIPGDISRHELAVLLKLLATAFYDNSPVHEAEEQVAAWETLLDSGYFEKASATRMYKEGNEEVIRSYRTYRRTVKGDELLQLLRGMRLGEA